MSRGSRIAIGIVCLMCALTFGLLSPLLGQQAPIGFWGILGTAVFFGVAAMACLVEKYSHITSRITAGGLCLIIMCLAGGMIMDGDFNPAALLIVVVGLGAGFYAATGQYPNQLPLANVFGGEASPPKKKKKKSGTKSQGRTRRPLPPLQELKEERPRPRRKSKPSSTDL